MMIPEGNYKVIDILCVSHSLSKIQSEGHEIQEYDIYKSVIENDAKKFIVYFLDDISIGGDSIIKIEKPLEHPILYKTDYKIIKKTDYQINRKLVNVLLGKHKK